MNEGKTLVICVNLVKEVERGKIVEDGSDGKVELLLVKISID